jgi:DNA polymerase-3 subunit delta'
MIYPWLQGTWEQFRSRAQGGNLPHALLLAGPAGTGKFELARMMVAYLLCLEPGETACGECRSCRVLAGGAHPDRFELLPEDERGVIKIDAVRDLLGRLVLTTTISPRKVALVWPAEGMTPNAANSLLKNLEEPPGDTIMLLVSNDPRRLPVTIRSRCQLLAVASPTLEAGQEWLQKASGSKATTAALALTAASGSPLRARDLLQDDAVQVFSGLRADLARILGQPAQASACAMELGKLDIVQLWRWLSLSAAEALRSCLGSSRDCWLEAAPRLDPQHLSTLVREADRNRALARTAVKQDLLLQDWLLEWARQPQQPAGS